MICYHFILVDNYIYFWPETSNAIRVVVVVLSAFEFTGPLHVQKALIERMLEREILVTSTVI